MSSKRPALSYADSGFLVSLYRATEATTSKARRAIRKAPLPVILSPLTLPEIRNALNFSIHRDEIHAPERDAVLRQVEGQLARGFFKMSEASQTDIYAKAQALSDRYTPTIATRSLDLMHVATALLAQASVFLTFDTRQAKAAKAEGLEVRP